MVRSDGTVCSDPLFRNGSDYSLKGRLQRNNNSNRCSCGKVIVKIQDESSSRPPRPQSVYERLYDSRVTQEINRRKLAASLIEDEARDCTYIPVTNSLRRQVHSASSLSSLTNRERRVEMARESFKEGQICVDCLKKVEIGTGTYLLQNMLDEEHPLALAHYREDSTAYGSYIMTPPREIFFVDTPLDETRKPLKTPLSTGWSRVVDTKDDRNDDNANRKSMLPPRSPHPNSIARGRAFSFDRLTPTSSFESDVSDTKLFQPIEATGTRDSHETALVRNMPQASTSQADVHSDKAVTSSTEQQSDDSSDDSGSSLRLVAYVGMNSPEKKSTVADNPIFVLDEFPSLMMAPTDERSETCDIFKDILSTESLVASAESESEEETEMQDNIPLPHASPATMEAKETANEATRHCLDEKGVMSVMDMTNTTGAILSSEQARNTSILDCEDNVDFFYLTPVPSDELEYITARRAYVGCEMESAKCNCSNSNEESTANSIEEICDITEGAAEVTILHKALDDNPVMGNYPGEVVCKIVELGEDAGCKVVEVGEDANVTASEVAPSNKSWMGCLDGCHLHGSSNMKTTIKPAEEASDDYHLHENSNEETNMTPPTEEGSDGHDRNEISIEETINSPQDESSEAADGGLQESGQQSDIDDTPVTIGDHGQQNDSTATSTIIGHDQQKGFTDSTTIIDHDGYTDVPTLIDHDQQNGANGTPTRIDRDQQNGVSDTPSMIDHDQQIGVSDAPSMIDHDQQSGINDKPAVIDNDHKIMASGPPKIGEKTEGKVSNLALEEEQGVDSSSVSAPNDEAWMECLSDCYLCGKPSV